MKGVISEEAKSIDLHTFRNQSRKFYGNQTTHFLPLTENLLKADSALLTHGGMERVSKQFSFSSPLSAPYICIPTLLCTHSSTLKLLINVARLKMSFPVATASLSTFSVLAGLQVMISNYLCISCCFSFPTRLMASRKAPSFLVNLGFFEHL